MGKSVPGTKRDRQPERGVPGFFVHPLFCLAHLSQRIVDLPAADVPRRTGDRIPIERDGDSAFPILRRAEAHPAGSWWRFTCLRVSSFPFEETVTPFPWCWAGGIPGTPGSTLQSPCRRLPLLLAERTLWNSHLFWRPARRLCRYVSTEYVICDLGFHIICEAQRCVPRKERGDEVVDRRRRLKCPTTIKSRGVGNSASLGDRSLILVDRVRERLYGISGLRGP